MGNDTSAPKKLFEQLDKTKDGVLTLDDLLNGNFTQSPLLLFRVRITIHAHLSKGGDHYFQSFKRNIYS